MDPACEQQPACAAASQPTLSQGPDPRSWSCCVQHKATISTMDSGIILFQKRTRFFFIILCLPPLLFWVLASSCILSGGLRYYFEFAASATILNFGLRLYFEYWPPLIFWILASTSILNIGPRLYFESRHPLLFWVLACLSQIAFERLWETKLRYYFESWPPLLFWVLARIILKILTSHSFLLKIFAQGFAQLYD